MHALELIIGVVALCGAGYGLHTLNGRNRRDR